VKFFSLKTNHFWFGTTRFMTKRFWLDWIWSFVLQTIISKPNNKVALYYLIIYRPARLKIRLFIQ